MTKGSSWSEFRPGTKKVQGFPLGWRQMSRSLSSWLAVTVESVTVSPSHPKVNNALSPSVTQAQLACAGLLFPSHKGDCEGKYCAAQCCAVSIMTMQLTQNPLSRGFLFPFPPARRQASQLKVPEARSPGPPGKATGGILTFASAPKPSTCSLGLTSSVLASPALLGVPLT